MFTLFTLLLHIFFTSLNKIISFNFSHSLFPTSKVFTLFLQRWVIRIWAQIFAFYKRIIDSRIDNRNYRMNLILSGNVRACLPGEICVGTFSQRRVFGIFSHSVWFALSDLYSAKFRALMWLRCSSECTSCISWLHDCTTCSQLLIK